MESKKPAWQALILSINTQHDNFLLVKLSKVPIEVLFTFLMV